MNNKFSILTTQLNVLWEISKHCITAYEAFLYYKPFYNMYNNEGSRWIVSETNGMWKCDSEQFSSSQVEFKNYECEKCEDTIFNCNEITCCNHKSCARTIFVSKSSLFYALVVYFSTFDIVYDVENKRKILRNRYTNLRTLIDIEARKWDNEVNKWLAVHDYIQKHKHAPKMGTIELINETLLFRSKHKVLDHHE